MIDIARLRITTVNENTSTRPGILGEWGQSILVEDGERRLLFDAGASASTVANADSLGIDLKTLDAIVLSHGHLDHTGGLAAVLSRIGRKIRVVAHPCVFDTKCLDDEEGSVYTGIPHRRELLESLGAEFQLSTGPTWLTDDIAASGVEPMTTDFESVAAHALVERDGRREQDPMLDDQSLYVRTSLGLVVVAGCAHRGIINIIRHGIALTGCTDVYLALGGTHLGPASKAQVDATIAALKDIGVQWLGLSHCTGLKHAARFAAEFGQKFFNNNAGTVLTFPLGG
jgi:7,8-dihydropterin-6-yl-methyl-4-(beta-D-ribofuranosyl)aminobenzene 5'-phosphate synthase